MLKKLILTLSVLSLAACAFNNDETGAGNLNKKLAENNARSAANFAKIEGVYQGEMIRDNGAKEVVQISLIQLSKKIGTNTDGSAILQYTNTAVYTRVKPASAPMTGLEVSFTPETGALDILNPDVNATNDDINTINTSIKGDIMTGAVKSKAGIIGRISLKKTVSQSSNGGNGSDEQYYARLRKELEAISGMYYGCVITTKEVSKRLPSFTAKMNLSKVEEQIGTGDNKTYRPRIAGSFVQNIGDPSLSHGDLSGTYRSDFVPAVLTLTGTYAGATNGYNTVFNGTLSESGEYVAEYANSKTGVEGTMYFKKGQKYPAKCANIR
jgi:hypothetical protein